MPFFIRKRVIPGKPSEKDKKKPPVKGKKAKKVTDDDKLYEKEEIASDEGSIIDSDEGAEGSEAESTDSELERETAQEKRLRLTKDYLSQVEAEIDEDADSEDDTDNMMVKRLAYDARKLSGKHHDEVADEILEPTEITILRGHQLSLTCLVISPDSKHIYTGSKDCSIIKWDAQTKKKVKVVHGGRKHTDHKGHTSHILCMAISDSNKFLVTGDQNSQLIVWNPDTMEIIRIFTGHKSAVTGAAFRRQSHELFTCSTDRSVKVWTLDEMAYIETVFGHRDNIQAIDAMTKERAITAGGRDNSIRVWKIVEESQFVFDSKAGAVDCVALIDEERFLTGTDTNKICVWLMSKKKPIATINEAHEGEGECWISAVRAMKNTDLFASGSRTGKIKLWKVTKTNETPTLLHAVNMPGFVNDLQFSNDGKFLAAAVGQEHKQGRWWSLKEAKNCLAIINLPRKATKTILRQL